MRYPYKVSTKATKEELFETMFEMDKEIERLEIDYQQANEVLAEQSEEIERLNNIINEVRELCLMFASGRLERTNYDDILEVIDKVGVDKE